MRAIEAVIQQQLDAYNAHDVAVLAKLYAEDAQQSEHPNSLIATGRTAIAARFATRFAENKPHAKLVSRIVSGNFVVDHEVITRHVKEGKVQVELVAMYEVIDAHIARAWFRFGVAQPMQKTG
jgi:uncharacterized protein (TIGR02246 family)